jgi:hypothetical protein
LEQARRTIAKAEADAWQAREAAMSVRRRARRAAKEARRKAKQARREAKMARRATSGRRSRRVARRMDMRVRREPVDHFAVQAAEALGWAVAAVVQFALLIAFVAFRHVAVPTAIFAFWLCRTVCANVFSGQPFGRRARSRRFVSP